MTRHTNAWPALPLEEWQDTYHTLHRWMQVVGKIRLRLSPHVNHWWQVPFYVTARGLTTSPMPYGDRVFEMTFDFVDHALVTQTSEGETAVVRLEPRTVADFYREVMARLGDLDIAVQIWSMPVEIENPIRFEEDREHASYDALYAERCWRILQKADEIFKQFRGGFVGKCSPVHFFWGSFDLAVTRFSGRRAPERAAADSITREAYSHEVISCGFWPGGGAVKGPAFYCYSAPEPPGFREASVQPSVAFYSSDLSQFLLMYDDVRTAASPERTLRAFLQSTYEAGAALGGWDREAMERVRA